jgi:hypothetical protein
MTTLQAAQSLKALTMIDPDHLSGPVGTALTDGHLEQCRFDV